MVFNEIVDRVSSIIANLNDFAENPIDRTLKPVLPFVGTGKIRLIIIGQDPTVQNAKSREKITTTLNLDKKGSLTSYISYICNALGIGIENVYATNVFKYFYTIPPAKTIDVLDAHLKPNLELLKEELSQYQCLPIIFLGEPVLQLLIGRDKKVRDYWGYSDGMFHSLTFEGHLTYSLPHQPSLRKNFYKDNLDGFLRYMKTNRVVPIRASNPPYGNGVVVDNKLITAAHVVVDNPSFGVNGHSLQTKDAIALRHDNIQDDGNYNDYAVFNYPEPNKELQLSRQLPNIGDVLMSYSYKKCDHKDSSSPFAITTEIDVPHICSAVVKEIIGNFIICEMSVPLEDGRSGSPLIKDGLVYGILHGGVNGNPCVFQSSVSILQTE